MTRDNPRHAEIKENDMNYGLTRGMRFYVQYRLLAADGTLLQWEDLLFQDENGDFKGLWCSRTVGTAAKRIRELIEENGTQASQYRIAARTWDEQIIEFNPNHGKAFNDPTYDYDADPDEDKIVDGDGNAHNNGEEPIGALNDDPQFTIDQ